MRGAKLTTIMMLITSILAILCSGPSTYAQAVEAYIWADRVEVSTGETFLVQVVIDPAGKGISSADITLSFNASVLEVLKVERGPLLGENVIELISEIDNTAGTVRYVAARVGVTIPPTPKEALISLTFKVRQDAESTKTDLSVKDIGLADEKPAEIKNIISRGLTIRVKSMETTTISPTPQVPTVTVTTTSYIPIHPPQTQATTVIIERRETGFAIILLTFLLVLVIIVAAAILISSTRRRKPVIIGVRQCHLYILPL